MTLRVKGWRESARQLGCSRNAVRRYLRDEDARRYGPRVLALLAGVLGTGQARLLHAKIIFVSCRLDHRGLSGSISDFATSPLHTTMAELKFTGASLMAL